MRKENQENLQVHPQEQTSKNYEGTVQGNQSKNPQERIQMNFDSDYYILSFLKLRSFIKIYTNQNYFAMQLQIQTLKKDPQRSVEQQLHRSMDLFKGLFQPPRTMYPSEGLLSQLRQIQLAVKADYHYLTNLQQKAFTILYEQDYEAQLTIIQRGFLSFKYILLERKLERSQHQQFIQKMNLNYETKKSIQTENHLAKAFYQKRLLKTVFSLIFPMIKVEKKQKDLSNYILQQRRAYFICLLREDAREKKNHRFQKQREDQEIDKIHERTTYKKVFNAFQLFSRLNKLEKALKTRALSKLVLKLIQAKKQTLLKLQKYKQAQALRIKRKLFEIMKQSKLQSQCLEWYTYRLQKTCFKRWLQYFSLAQDQNQIQESNEIILKHFLESKSSERSCLIQTKYFSLWRSYALFEKQQKKQTRILKSFAELKQKEYLERKYFLILKENRYYEKSLRFCQKRLKFKYLEALRKNVIAKSKKFQNVYKFIQKRTIKKYFKGIQLFNKLEAKKVYLRCLLKAWLKFTLNITAEYFEKSQKAKNYHETLLKFKSIIGLKEAVELNKKESYCSYSINIALPLIRWNQGFRLRKWVQDKQNQFLKRTFFEWKLLTIRKFLSQQKQASTSELFVESIIKKKNNNRKASKESQIMQNKNKKGSEISEPQISFFKKMEYDQSGSDDEVERKVDALLTKIKSQRKRSEKEQYPGKGGEIFSNERLLFPNEGLSQILTKQKGEKLRLPTWSTPGNDYQVSVFQEDHQD